MLSLQVLCPKPTDNSIMGECGKMVLFHPCEREPHHGAKLVVLPTSAGCARVTLVLICLMIHVWWPDKPSVTSSTPLKPNKPRRRRSKGPRRFAGLIHQPRCEACEQGDDTRPQALELPLPVITFTRGLAISQMSASQAGAVVTVGVVGPYNRRREIVEVNDALGGIRDVFAGSEHGKGS
jgi:hypothetical protein